MLVAMSLTLLMMATVIGVFANVSESVANRRASIEMSTRLRHARNLLQADLSNHTCPALTWTRPESNHGYLEIVEGPQSDFDPSIWLRDEDNDGNADPVGPSGNQLQIDLAVSQLPSSTLGRLPGSGVSMNSQYVTDGGGLGDWDDVLTLTVRNDAKPFVGRVPANVSANGEGFDAWGAQEIESPLAEVVWFAVENPVEPSDARTFYFGEPGFRTVYRRVLLIAPQLDYGFEVNNLSAGRGVVRVLPTGIDLDEPDQAVSALIAFQELYDLSVRLEWNPLLGDDGRWVLLANTLADLTKRENRYDHQHLPMGTPGSAPNIFRRRFPHLAVGCGRLITGAINVRSVRPPESRVVTQTDSVLPATNVEATGRARQIRDDQDTARVYSLQDPGTRFGSRPYAYVDDPSIQQPTTRAIVNEDGEVVMFTNGYVPLSGDRRGEDVVLSNMLAFDIKVYDPEAPLLAELPDTNDQNYPGEVVSPSDPAWGLLAWRQFSNGVPSSPLQPVVSRGAYVDLGYAGLHAYFAFRNEAFNSTYWNGVFNTNGMRALMSDSVFAGTMTDKSQLGSAFRFPNRISGPYAFQPYRSYDTWSTSYENNGKNDNNSERENGVIQLDDGDNQGTPLIDEGANGFDDDGVNGVDDPGERETAPPYDAALRGVQVTLRAYELDSRQIREVNVKQTFVPK